MKFEEAKAVIRSLSRSQGFYGRLLRSINEFDNEGIEKFSEFVKPFKEPLDLVMAIEC